MLHTIFPNETVSDLTALSEWLSRQTDDVSVAFSEGEYYGTLTFDAISCPSVTLTAPNGAVLTGGRTIDCTFQRTSPTVMECCIGSGFIFERLKIDGVPQILARYPKYRENERLNGTQTLGNIEKFTSACLSVEGAYLHSLHEHEWGSNDYRVIGRDKDGFRLSWIGNNNRGGTLKKDCCYLENLPELLTGENEWYYNKNSGVLYITDTSDCTEKTASVTLCDKINLVNIRNCKQTKLSISGFTFANTDRSMFRQPWVRYLRSDWAFNYGSAVEIRDSENVSFSDCRFHNLGANGIGIFAYNNNITVDNCDFENSLTNGILILGNPDSTYCTSSWEGDRHIAKLENAGEFGAASEHYPRNITVSRCLFQNLGTEDKQSAGVCISLAHKVTVSQSTFCRLPRAGINICENAFGGHTVCDCDLFDCVRETGDHGPFNSWGRDRFWSLNGFDTEGKSGMAKKPFALCDMLEENRIIHNRVVGTRGFGIDLDDGSTNYVIENNFCFGVGIKLREGFFRKVRNNVILYAPLDLHATYEENDDILEHNVVCNKHPLRIALLRKGYTTQINNNYFVNASARDKKQKILRGMHNQFVSCDPSDILQNRFSFDGFTPFAYNFGKDGAPKPDCSLAAENVQETKKFMNRYGVFSFMDERLRSATGAMGLDGVYVERLRLFSKLKKRGIQKNDVILTVNGEPFFGTAKEFAVLLQNGSEAEIIRQQKRIVIK